MIGVIRATRAGRHFMVAIPVPPRASCYTIEGEQNDECDRDRHAEICGQVEGSGGSNRRGAEGLARALGDELAERIVTKSDLDGALRPIYARFDAIDAKFDTTVANSDARFDAIDARFDAIDAKFDTTVANSDARFDAIDARFDTTVANSDAKFDAMIANSNARFDASIASSNARFDALDAKIDAVHRELTGKFNILAGVMALGFTLLTGLGGYNAVSPRFDPPVIPAPEVQREAKELPEPASRSGVEG